MSLQFDKQFNKAWSKQDAMTKTLSLFFKLWFVWAFMCLVGAAGLVYVVIHFLAKLW